ncbi:hypothetical protein HDZ31DRAFT_14535, partial [Schizophyllum fasciatum]
LTCLGPDGHEVQDTADVLFTGFGMLSRWAFPDIHGLQNFQGLVIHSAHWETDDPGKTWQESTRSWGDKCVAVIGNGSSGIQIVTAMQPHVARLVNFVRSKTWVTGAFGSRTSQELTGQTGVDDYKFSDDDKRAYHDLSTYQGFRRQLETEVNSAFPLLLRGGRPQAEMRKELIESTKKRLAKKPWIAEYLVPEYSIGCSRPTPGPGYLEALCEDNVDFVPSSIKHITKDAIFTEDGSLFNVDIIVCATGYDTSFDLGFPFVGKGGVDLSEKYEPHPRTYLGIAVDDFPNWFQSFGPNSAPGAGSVALALEKQVDYAVKATVKLQREHLKSMEVKKEAVNDFNEYLEAFFPASIFTEPCKSWYKNGQPDGRVRALYPGSTLHLIRALEHPRWEDYTYELLEGNHNRFHWFGNGGTMADLDPAGNKTFYMDNIDYPP